MDMFLADILKKIIEKPQELAVTLTQDEYSIVLTVIADPTDCGRIIGKKGKTINALRNLMYIWSHKKNDALLSRNKKIVIRINP